MISHSHQNCYHLSESLEICLWALSHYQFGAQVYIYYRPLTICHRFCACLNPFVLWYWTLLWSTHHSVSKHLVPFYQRPSWLHLASKGGKRLFQTWSLDVLPSAVIAWSFLSSRFTLNKSWHRYNLHRFWESAFRFWSQFCIPLCPQGISNQRSWSWAT